MFGNQAQTTPLAPLAAADDHHQRGVADPTASIADLRRGQPDATLKNLLCILNSKLDLCALLPVFEWEARDEGHDECAAAIRQLADTEKGLCADVMLRLQHHLEAGMPT